MKRVLPVLALLSLGACTNMTGPDCGAPVDIPMHSENPNSGDAPTVTAHMCIGYGNPQIPGR